MTITISFKDGTTKTFTSCRGLSDDGKIIRFNGIGPGETGEAEWNFNWDVVASYKVVNP